MQKLLSIDRTVYYGPTAMPAGRSAASYRLLVTIKDVLFGEESHAVHQTHLTVALLSTNIDAFTLACTHRKHTYTQTHTHKAKHK